MTTPAFAQTAPAAATPSAAAGGIASLISLLLIFVVFYFLLIRPQQKKMKQHQAMVAALRRGDKIVTAGGLIATVNKIVDENELVADIADNVQVRIVRSTISSVLTKPEPVANDNPGNGKKNKASNG